MASIRLPLDYKEHTNRAVHDLSEVCRTTLPVGLLVPTYFRRMYAGDKFIIKIPNIRINSLPLASPLLGNFRLRHEIVFESDANLYGFLDNNDKKDTEFFLNDSHKNTFYAPNFIKRTTEASNLFLSHFSNDENMGDATFAVQQLDENGNLIEVDVPQQSDIHTYLYRLGSFIPLYEYTKAYRGTIAYYSSFEDDLDAGNWLDPTTVFNVRPGSLADYIGIPSGYTGFQRTHPVSFNQPFCVDYIFAYLDYWRSYHRNTQEAAQPYCRGMYMRNDAANIFGNFAALDLDAIDKLFRNLHCTQNGVTINNDGSIAWPIDSDSVAATPNSQLTLWQQTLTDYMESIYSPGGGLFASTYMPDLWRNILANNNDAVRSKVTVTNGEFSIEEFRYANRLQQIIDRFSVSGGRFSNWLQTIFGVKPRRQLDIPELIGVRTDWIGTTTVTSTAHSSDNPLGSVGAKIDQTRGSDQKYTVTADTNGILMIVVSIVPEVDYFQNLMPHIRTVEFTDEYFPQLANKGFDQVPSMDYTALAQFNNGRITYAPGNVVVGKQVAWLGEMTAVNRLHGEFSENGVFKSWAIGRQFQRTEDSDESRYLAIRNEDGDTHRPWPDWLYNIPRDYRDDVMETLPFSQRVKPAYMSLLQLPKAHTKLDLSTYVNPLDYDYLFESDGLSVPPFQYQAVYDVKAIRPIGRRIMPTLE